MAYRVFKKNRSPPEGRPRAFGRRSSWREQGPTGLSRARLAKAALLGVGIGVLVALVAPGI